MKAKLLKLFDLVSGGIPLMVPGVSGGIPLMVPGVSGGIPLMVLFLFLFTFLPAYSQGSLWETAQRELYPVRENFVLSNEVYFDPCIYQLSSEEEDDNFLPLSFKSGIIDTNLPGKSHLTVRGRKVIGIKYTHFHYINPKTEEQKKKTRSTTDIEQKLQVNVKGKIGTKISVNVDYDDTLPRTEQQKVHLTYRGKENEIVQEVNLGDMTLSLPKTEFVSYSKSVFGARIRAKWKDFYLMGIGSVTKGISETKTFTGKTTFEKRDIPDTSYLKQKYFKLYFDQLYPPDEFGNPSFSYTSGSAEIWIDDEDGTNNVSGVTVEMTVEPTSGDSAYTGYFDLQYLGQDYSVDYERGVINFYKNIGDQFVIAVRYKDKDGNYRPATGYRMIKKGPDPLYYKYEIDNRYYLGSKRINQNDFVLKIIDLSGNVVYDWANPSEYASSYKVNIDFDFGIAKITNPASAGTYYEPFPDAYPPNCYHRYTLHTEFSHAIEAYFLRPDIVPKSEKVYLDGKLLVRDEDYVIDYSSGYLSFVDPSRITSTTKIRVDYEYSPFFGGQATILGARLQFIPNKKFLGLSNFSLGSTFLSQSATKANKVPKVGSTPTSQDVMEVDTHFSLHPNLGGKFPIDISFSGELAKSTYNPNIFGKAMLEDFSSTKVEDDLPMNKDSWHLSSIPPGQDPLKRNNIQISDEKIKGEKVNPIWSKDDITVLNLKYDFTSASWDSVVYSLSPVGKDYTNMKYLEVWVNKIPSGATVHLDLGLVSEDANGNGKLDTEDKNGDGILNPGEDANGNGKLDTEDLDGDGKLDKEENFSTYNLADYEYKEPIPHTGWFKYTIPLNSDSHWKDVKILVKHIRIWITGSGNDTVKFAKISISGDRWEKYNVEIKGVNNYDDIDFPDPLKESSEFRKYYKDMYGTYQTSEGKYRKESAIAISGETGYIQETFISPKDFSDYSQINLWLYQENPTGGEFYIRFGSDVDDNYYEYNYPLSSPSVWVNIKIPFSQLNPKGNPSFSKINQVRLGISGIASIHIYLNDIYLSNVCKKEGQAERYSLKANLSKYLSLMGEHKKVDSSFSIIGSSPTNQQLKINRWAAKLSLISFMPISYQNLEKSTRNIAVEKTALKEVEKSRRLEKSEVYKTEFNLIPFLPISYQLSKESIHSISEETTYQEDKKLEESKSYKVGFRLPPWPKLIYEGSNSLTHYPIRENPEKITKDSHKLSLDYRVPVKFFLLPTNISSSYQLDTTKTEIESKPSTKDITKKGSITLPFRPAKNFSFEMGFSQSDTTQITSDTAQAKKEERPKSRGKSLNISSKLSLFQLSPRMDYKGGCTEDNFSSSNKRKVSANSKISYSLPFRWNTFFKKPKILQSLSYYTSYTLEKQLIYENTTTSLDFFNQVGLKDIHPKDGYEKLNLEKKSLSLRQTWHPFNFLVTSLEYGKVEDNEVKEGAPLFTTVKSWPVGSLNLDLNSTPLIDRVSGFLFTSSRLLLKSAKKETVKRNISTAVNHQLSVTWKVTFKRLKNLSSTFTYKSTKNEEKPYGQEGKTLSLDSTYGLKFDYYTYLPWGAKIPLIRRIINFKNEIHLSTSLSRELKQKEVALKKSEDNKTWKLTTHIAYKMMENVNIKLGLEGTYFKDKVKVGEDYYSLGGSAYVEITF